MGFRVIIPIRYAAKRLPGKALIEIAKKPMVQHVYERALQSGAESVVIATDDERIQQVAEGFGATVCITSPEHPSGTERLAEAVVALGYDDDEIVVNVQGDQPLLPPSVIHQVANNLMMHDNTKVATLCAPITHAEQIINPNIVKVVMNRRGFALYFSRAPIAWEQGKYPPKANQTLSGEHFRHIGLYAYRVGFLQEYLSWESCVLEEMESLEQLRVLWNGGRIHVAIAKEPVPIGVDTEADLDKIRSQI
jgi:3-deoxy-manno-octulosonate cytidylyltransferase (CMP-KDO synthetase)